VEGGRADCSWTGLKWRRAVGARAGSGECGQMPWGDQDARHSKPVEVDSLLGFQFTAELGKGRRASSDKRGLYDRSEMGGRPAGKAVIKGGWGQVKHDPGPRGGKSDKNHHGGSGERVGRHRSGKAGEAGKQLRIMRAWGSGCNAAGMGLTRRFFEFSLVGQEGFGYIQRSMGVRVHTFGGHIPLISCLE
jgi:hypothetical protein